MRFVSWLFAITLACVATAPAAAAEATDNCDGTISSLPVVVATAGTWCLDRNLATAIASGAAVTIATDNVIVDCNGFTLDGRGGGLQSLARGVMGLGVSNAVVRHCRTRGFYIGVQFGNGGSHELVEKNLIEGSGLTGVDLDGEGSVIRRNRIYDGGGASSTGCGIATSGWVDILDNTIAGLHPVTTSPVGEAYGICTSDGGLIAGNRIRRVGGSVQNVVRGIRVAGGWRSIVRDNDIVGENRAGSLGVSCETTGTRIRDNTISGFAIANDGCGDTSGNVVRP